MDAGPLLRKEVRWSRRKLLVILFLFVLLPGAFAYSALAFDTVLPEDAPVAVVAQSDAVDEQDLSHTRLALRFFSDPVNYDDRETAFRALSRERVYAVVTVPANLTDTSTEARYHLYVDGATVPYLAPSEASSRVMRLALADLLPASVEVDHTVRGTEHSLSAYLLPTFLMALVMLVSLAYFPYTLANEEPAVERVRLTSSLTAMVTAKLALFGGLLVLPVTVFQVLSWTLDYPLSALSVGALAAVLLTFTLLGSIAAAITLVTRFSTTGRLFNLAVMFFTMGFSGLVYPAGFFSPSRRQLIRLLPTHYSMVALRGYTLRGSDLGLYADWLLGLAVLCVAGLGLVAASARVYEWRA